MIQTYDETWKFYIRQLHLTSRRGDFFPYCVNSSLYDFINAATDTILDIGCGENNLKLFFPNKIHGVDRTIEADTFAFINDNEFNNLPAYKYGIAVNSLHWDDIDKNILTATQKCKKIWISLNENQPIDKWKHVDAWKKYGTVEYFWHGQKIETKDRIRQCLENDHLYPHASTRRNTTIDDDVEIIYNTTVLKDPYYGVVRAVISNY